MSRDPIGEEGGINSCLFAHNSGIWIYDILGLALPPDLVARVGAMGREDMKVWIKQNPTLHREMYQALRRSGRTAASQAFKWAQKTTLLRPSSLTKGAASLRVLRAINAAAVGVVVANVAVNAADAYDLWDDDMPDLNIKEMGPDVCPAGCVRAVAKLVHTTKTAEAKNVFLFGILGTTHPKYWFENSLVITFDCRDRYPDANTGLVQIDDRARDVGISLGFGFAESSGTVFWYQETVEYP